MSRIELLLSKEAPVAGVAVLFVYVIGVIVQRLYFSPIAKFPGPKLAAATFWYEFYFDVIQPGQYTWQIRKMHQKYGPIVRINPYELHINDPEFYDEVYSGPSERRDKWQWFYKLFGNTLSMFGTLPHDLHRLRRAALNPYFSKQSVARLAPVIQSLVGTLCGRLREAQKSGGPVNLGVAYTALTTDVITEYCFGQAYDYLADFNLASQFHEIMVGVGFVGHLVKQFGWLFPLMQAMPTWFVALANPQMMPLIRLEENIKTQIQAILDGKMGSHEKNSDHPSIFQELLDSSLPAAEKSFKRLVDEGGVVVTAGAYSTARVLATTSFYLLSNPEILRTLRTELTSAAQGSSVSLQQLENLPYFSAVVLEGLRLSNPISSRLPRMSPERPIIFREWIIPAGTPVSMTSSMMHENPQIFPEPHEFKPDRWLQGSSKGRLDRYLAPFSKGTRSCLGINLAYAEFYLTLAKVFSEFDMELYETTREDVDVAHDAFAGAPRRGSKGIRVIVK